MAPVQDTQNSGIDKASKSFLDSYKLPCRWQLSLEFFLFHFCRVNRPQIIAECGWPCFEAAELTRLSEKVTEHYCFHDKKKFLKYGLSTEERERFCTSLHEVRQIRNAAVHREKVSATTMRRYARDALGVFETLRRLGGEDFEQACGKALDGLFHSFWDIDYDIQAIIPPLGPLLTNYGQDPIKNMPAHEKKQRNIRLAMEGQKSAERRRAFNIAKMVEDSQVAQQKRTTNQQRTLDQKKTAAEVRAAREQKVNDQEDRAAVKRRERAFKVQMQEEVAHQAKQERAKKAENLQLAAKEGKRIRQQRQELVRAIV